MSSFWGQPTQSNTQTNSGGFWGGQSLNNSGFSATFQPTDETLYDRDLVKDKYFQQASRIIYDMNNSSDAPRLFNDADYARYGIEQMGWFNYNLPNMTLDASRISGATDEQKRAFLYMMEAYEELGVSWKGTARFFKGVIFDPTTYIGLGTFGIGTVAKGGVGTASKETIKSLLKQSTKGGVIAGVEAGIWGAVDDINRQVVETSVSGEDIDYYRTLKQSGIYAATGFGAGTILTAGAKKLLPKVRENSRTKLKEVEEEKLLDAVPELTVEEIAVAKSPQGRARVSVQKVIQKLRETAPRGTRTAETPQGTKDLEELVKATEPIRKVLTEASSKSPDDLAKHFTEHEMTIQQAQLLEVASNQAVTVLKSRVYKLLQEQKKVSGKEAEEIRNQIDRLEEVIAPLDELDAALSTFTGQSLRARREGMNTGELRAVTINSLMQDGFARSDAEKKWDDIFSNKLIAKERTEEIRELNKKIEIARKSPDQTEWFKLKDLKRQKELEYKEEALAEEGSGLYRAINKPIKFANEVMISFVFSPATLIINTVPSLAKMAYKPFLNNLMKDGLTRQSLKTMMAEYTAMASIAPTALKSAKAAWRYERSILTGDSARFLEDYNTIPKKYGGGWIRFFPRALLASDAFFESIHYRGYVVGKATSEAMEKGVKEGVDDLDGFVKKSVSDALDKAYTPEENAVDMLMADGASRGYKGERLQRHVNDELENNTNTFTKATLKEGKNYVQDVLFKRDFSGEGTASKLARGYESFVNKNPVMRMAGQLFFRTPVRVFEEGMRLTAGLNLISPNFVKDLKGVNGQMRQIRAQGEAMLSYAIAGSVFTLYSTGSVKGSMTESYKQSRQGENTGEVEPYTFIFSDGSSFNYRNFDPFATPVKIIVNALERAETLMYRREQGEKISDTAIDQVQAYIAVAVGSIGQSIRDANLASGVDAIWTLVEDLQDEEGSEQLVKFVGQKVQTFLPNTYYKVKMLDNPVLGDPATLMQFIKYRINPDDPLVPKQYTALGRPRTLSNPWANLIYFDRVTNEERKRGVPKKELEVEQFLWRLAQVGDTHFTAPYQHRLIKGLDLRTKLTLDGTESLYDRWMTMYHESGVIDILHQLRKLPMGTESDAGIAEKQAKRIINKFREMTFRQLMNSQGLDNEAIKQLIRKYEAETGQLYIENVPNQ
tara:strand:- start:396 stop:3914 length:3519 start_codon:yes stop_codon:yes gene_type:complete